MIRVFKVVHGQDLGSSSCFGGFLVWERFAFGRYVYRRP